LVSSLKEESAYFKHADFMLAIDGALASGARVPALLSREYLASEHCRKEALQVRRVTRASGSSAAHAR
jgi:hypothetical protein